jgi:phage terminase Nu1 subunit (DNA packaging protein)
MALLTDANVIFSAHQLGEVLGLSFRHVNRLTSEGVLKCAGGNEKGRRYRLGECVQAYLRHHDQTLARQLQQNDDGYLQARRRRMEAAAEMSELQLAVTKGELHHSDDIEYHYGQLLINFKARLLAIPARTARPLIGATNFQVIYDLLMSEIEMALRELVNYAALQATDRNGAHDD